jgi:general secretion pathway protein D
VKVGEQFSAVLQLQSQGPLRGVPILVGFDPQVLQWVQTQEGDFFKQGGGTTVFNQRVDPAQGKVFASVIRQNAAGADAGVNGLGSVLVLSFKALKPAQARLQLLSATPEPAPATPLALPVERLVRIVP